MSNSGLANLYARVHGTLKRAGLADGGTEADSGALLRRKSGTELPCRVLLRFNAQRVGRDGQVTILPAEITVLRADIGDALPAHGDAFIVGDTLYRVEAPIVGAINEGSVACHCMAGVPA